MNSQDIEHPHPPAKPLAGYNALGVTYPDAMRHALALDMAKFRVVGRNGLDPRPMA